MQLLRLAVEPLEVPQATPQHQVPVNPQADKVVEKEAEEKVPEHRTFKVATGKVDLVIKMITKFNKGLEKLGTAPITYTLSQPYMYEIPGDNTQYQNEEYKPRSKQAVEVQDITIMGDPMSSTEWIFAGRKEESGKDNYVFFKSPNFKEEIPESFRGPLKCDHCQTKHQRNKTYIFKNKKTGEWKEAGGQCLNYFMGNIHPEKYEIFWSTLVKEISESLSAGHFRVDVFNKQEYLACVVADVELLEAPFTTSKQVQQIQHGEEGAVSTAQDAARWYFDIFYNQPYYALKVTEEERKEMQDMREEVLNGNAPKKAQEILAWWETDGGCIQS
jgi:hypothetical protein